MSHHHDEEIHDAVLRRITYSLPEYVLVQEQARLAKDCLDRIVEGVEKDDGNLVHAGWERLTEPMSYLSAIMQQRANVAYREVTDERP